MFFTRYIPYAANSIDTSVIRNNIKSGTSSVIYSGADFDLRNDNSTVNEHYSDPTRPLLRPQNSILTLKSTIWKTCDNGSSMIRELMITYIIGKSSI